MTLFGEAPAAGGSRTGVVEHTADRNWTVTPTAHPVVPRELSLLWLAPADEDRVAATSVLGRFASGVALYRQGKYADALTRIPPPKSLDNRAAGYAAYYAAQAQLKLGRIESARRQFAILVASQPVGYLSEAAALGEATAAETAGDHLALLVIWLSWGREESKL